MPTFENLEYKMNKAGFGIHEVICTNTKILLNLLYQTPL